MSLGRRIAWAVAALLGPLLAAAVAAPWLVDVEAYKPVLVQAVKEATGRELVIEGPMRLRMLPVPRVSAQRVHFANAAGAEGAQMVDVRWIGASPSWWALLRGEVEIGQLTLYQPTIVLETDADGVPNWQFKPGAGASQAAGAPAEGFHLAIGELRVVQGTLSYTNPQTRQTIKAEQVEATAQVRSLQGPLAISGKATVNGVPLSLDVSMSERKAEGHDLVLCPAGAERQARLQGTHQRAQCQGRIEGTPRRDDRRADRLHRRDGARRRPGEPEVRRLGGRPLHLRRRRRAHADAACHHRLQDDDGCRDRVGHAGLRTGRHAVAEGPGGIAQDRSGEMAGAAGQARCVPAGPACRPVSRQDAGAGQARFAVAVPGGDGRVAGARRGGGRLSQGHGARPRRGGRDPQGRDHGAAAQGRAAGRHARAGDGRGERRAQRHGTTAARDAGVARDRSLRRAGGQAAAARPQGQARRDGQQRADRRPGGRARRPARDGQRQRDVRHAACPGGDASGRPLRSRRLSAGRAGDGAERASHAAGRQCGDAVGGHRAGRDRDAHPCRTAAARSRDAGLRAQGQGGQAHLSPAGPGRHRGRCLGAGQSSEGECLQGRRSFGRQGGREGIGDGFCRRTALRPHLQRHAARCRQGDRLCRPAEVHNGKIGAAVAERRRGRHAERAGVAQRQCDGCWAARRASPVRWRWAAISVSTFPTFNLQTQDAGRLVAAATGRRRRHRRHLGSRRLQGRRPARGLRRQPDGLGHGHDRSCRCQPGRAAQHQRQSRVPGTLDLDEWLGVSPGPPAASADAGSPSAARDDRQADRSRRRCAPSMPP